MGESTAISWTDATFNPWHGCQRVSPGCENCYAEAFVKRIGYGTTKPKLWGPTSDRRQFANAHWNEPVKWNAAAQATGVPMRVFCASMADVFEDRRDLDEPRARLFALIEATPWLRWQLLTKRPENMARLAPERWAKAWPRHVWAGTTCEDQEHAEKRIPELLKVPTSVRFVSYEPAIGPVDFNLGRCEVHGRDEIGADDDGAEFCIECAADDGSGELSFGHWLNSCADIDQPGINWVIGGGESGAGRRPCETAWFDDVAKQCADTGVAYFQKQDGGQRPGQQGRISDATWALKQFPADGAEGGGA